MLEENVIIGFEEILDEVSKLGITSKVPSIVDLNEAMEVVNAIAGYDLVVHAKVDALEI